jgi:hypothetical protein
VLIDKIGDAVESLHAMSKVGLVCGCEGALWWRGRRGEGRVCFLCERREREGWGGTRGRRFCWQPCALTSSPPPPPPHPQEMHSEMAEQEPRVELLQDRVAAAHDQLGSLAREARRV